MSLPHAASLQAAWFAATHPTLALKRVLLGHRWADAPRSAIQQAMAHGVTVVEAGAANGDDTLWLQSLPEVARVVAVEPHPHAAELLRRRTRGLAKVIVVEAALAAHDGTAALHVSRNSGLLGTDSSSLLRPTAHLTEYPHVDFSERIEVPTIRLDSLLNSLGHLTAGFLWLDLQGKELEVLEAAPAAVSQVESIYLEASRVPLYDGACTLMDIRRFMVQEGFRMRVERIGRVSGNVLYSR
jgi:FkbM family methyltransferase